MSFIDCFAGFLIVCALLLLLSMLFFLFCLLIFVVLKSIGCFDEFVKKEDLKSCCFNRGKNE